MDSNQFLLSKLKNVRTNFIPRPDLWRDEFLGGICSADNMRLSR